MGKWVISGDVAALIRKICVKKLQKFIRTSAQREKCSATLAPIQVLALLIFLKSANLLLWVNFFTRNTFLCVFACIPIVLETLRRLWGSKWEISMAWNWIGASAAEHFRRCALPRIYFCNVYTHIFRISAAPSPSITHYRNLFTMPLI
jgi:hypothetical protein